MARFLFSFGDEIFFGRWDHEMQTFLEKTHDFPTMFSKWYDWDHKPAVGEPISIGSLWFSPFRVVEVKHMLEGPNAGIEVVMMPIRGVTNMDKPLTRHDYERLAELGWMADYKPIVLE